MTSLLRLFLYVQVTLTADDGNVEVRVPVDSDVADGFEPDGPPERNAEVQRRVTQRLRELLRDGDPDGAPASRRWGSVRMLVMPASLLPESDDDMSDG